MKKAYIIVIAIMLMTVLLAAKEKCMGECPDGKPEMRERLGEKHQEGMMLKHMAEELELTEAQIETMHEIQLDHKKFMIQIKADIEILQLDKKAALKAKAFSDARKITEKIFEKKQQIALAKVDLQEERWNLLTAEQKLKAQEMKHEKMQAPHKMSEKMKGKHDM